MRLNQDNTQTNDVNRDNVSSGCENHGVHLERDEPVCDGLVCIFSCNYFWP